MFSLPYLLLTTIIFFLYLNESRKITLFTPKSARWMAYIILWVFVGFRGHLMSDFIVYYNFYNEQCPVIYNLNNHTLFNFEPGFVVYTSIIKTIGLNYFSFIALSTLIDFIVLAWFFKRYCQSMILPIIFFIAFNGLLIEFNLLRNIKAIDLFLISFPYLQKRKFAPYLIHNLLGTLFHSSALLYIPMFFILQKKIPKWLIWGGFATANIIYLSNIHLISDLINQMSLIEGTRVYDKISAYASSAKEYKFSLGYFERTITFILFSFLYAKLIAQNKANIIFYNCYWLYYVTFLIFNEVTVFSERIPYLFMFSYWILYPEVYFLNYRYRNFVSVAITLLVILKVYTTYNMPSCKYENVLTGISDYTVRKALVIKDLKSR